MLETQCRYIYSPEEQRAVEDAIAARFGSIDYVLREIISPEIRIDLCIAAPREDQPYYTIITRGMGARGMRPPEDSPENMPEDFCARAELVVMLPPAWEPQSREECWYWPLRWLKLLARLPAAEDSWLGANHTVPNGEPFCENTDYSAILLLDAYIPESRALAPAACLPNGEALRFYQLFPLYEEELRYKLEHGAAALLRRFGGTLSPVLDPARPSVCPETRQAPEKRFQLEKHQLRPLLEGWNGPGGCLATDRILVDGMPVGYCYRETSCGDWDSGWRFTAGDESDEYMDTAAHSGMYSLNCLANYDPDILAILREEAPCAFVRGARGLERLKNIK
ncbi:MAG: DUF2185 domain-containing protein [Oscillospiraceae bacterium]|nr:DUF2185 domain-containing protein [Oscillospiraceae bacterium]